MENVRSVRIRESLSGNGMSGSMINLLSWMLTMGTVTVFWLAGNKDRRAWVLGIILQVPWLVFDYFTKAYGLMPLALVLSYMYIRNYIKWRSDGR